MPRDAIALIRLRSTAYAMAWRTLTSWTAGLNFASGQFCSLQRLNVSCVKEGEVELTASTSGAFFRRAKVACWTSGTRSISPSVSARSTASSLPYLIHCTSSNAGFSPRKFGLRVIRMRRPRSIALTT